MKTPPQAEAPLVEKIAQALHKTWRNIPDEQFWDRTVDLRWQEWLPYARAVARLAVEECARVAENYRNTNPQPTVYAAIAASIRALVEPGEKG